ncbi:hypothetical protein EV384_4212 [Micromonospora kangleipakensis]|uniref:Uncharacterized protein n=1 Tax=Micromonospora kangleipakensis TaxID=1077942 RepID=A0A4Q8BDB7_9ACTN|nr:hypothetical protein [Micromonospora kangleipakensis]RZU75658.1 hypothetical protein EV384_4212 [Micromonospora kangleipakensis]
MKKRYVARVSMPGRFARGPSRTDGPPVARGSATPPGADTAVAPDVGVAAVAAAPGGTPPPPQPPVAAPTGVAPVPPGSAPPTSGPGPVRGVAPLPDPADGAGIEGATQLLQAPDVTAAIFVDGSGRRARTLRRVVSAVVLLALLLIVALWASQGAEVLGLRVPA